jgi:hypothetical protein
LQEEKVGSERDNHVVGGNQDSPIDGAEVGANVHEHDVALRLGASADRDTLAETHRRHHWEFLLKSALDHDERVAYSRRWDWLVTMS